MRFILAACLLANGPLAASEVSATFNDTTLHYEGEGVTQCRVFEQGGLYYVSVEAGDADGPGILLDYSGDSLATVMFELRLQPGWPNWTASNSPLYNNHGGGVQVESHITLRDGSDTDGVLVFDARMIFQGGDAHAEADAVIEVTCD